MLIVDIHPQWSGRDWRRRIPTGVAQFLSGFSPLVEVQGFAELLAFQGHAEGVWTFRCRRLVVEPYVSEGMVFFLVGASFWQMRSNMSSLVWVK